MTLYLPTALMRLSIDKLESYAYVLSPHRVPIGHRNLVIWVYRYLCASLTRVWERLDEIDKAAVADTLYLTNGTFDADLFRAKYTRLPPFFGWRAAYRERPPLARLLLYVGEDNKLVIPEDLAEKLKEFVPEPVPFKLEPQPEVPQFFEQVEFESMPELLDRGYDIKASICKSYDIAFTQEPLAAVPVAQIPITQCNTEIIAQHDLQAVLRLIDRGKLSVSEKSYRPPMAVAREVSQWLRGGDFYDIKDSEQTEPAIGPIRGYAWPMLMQAAKLAENQGQRLVLTKAGVAAINESPAAVLKRIFKCWLGSKLLDEFQRIDQIKGQGQVSEQSVAALKRSRTAIVQALESCPSGEWIKFDDFSRFMQTNGLHFEISRSPWRLYISSLSLGSLGMQSAVNWCILQGRYLRCFLFEYAATMGLVDVAYIPPEAATRDFRGLYGSADMPFLSRYDGLLYFRLNQLGEYCLERRSDYTPPKIEARAKVSVMPSLRVSILEESSSPASALLLDTYGEQEAPGVWRLARDKAIAALEVGHKIAELREFLQASDDQPLPETVEAFIDNADRQARALTHKGLAVLIECADEKIADAIASHNTTKGLCQRTGKKGLVVLAEVEEQFHRAVNLIGYGMPKV